MTDSQAFRVEVTNLKDGDGMTPGYLAVVVSSHMEDTSPDVCVVVQEGPAPTQDLRIEAQNLLIAIQEHDDFIDPTEQDILNLAIAVLDRARCKEEMALTINETMSDQVSGTVPS